MIAATYDDLSRLTQITTPDNVLTYTYDGVGNLTKAEDNDSKVEFTYDGRNLVLTATTTDKGAQPAVTLTNVYDAVRNRTSIGDGSGTQSFEYDGAARLTKLTTAAASVINLTYDTSGRRDTIDFPNGVTTDRTYDTNGRLQSITHTLSPSPAFLDLAYTYNPVGNVLSMTDDPQPRSFTYDELQRLKTAGTASAPEFYNYDSVGNRTSSHLASSYTHIAGNQLTGDDDFTYTYDDNGNLKTKTDKVTLDVTTYHWGSQNQLIGIDFPDSTSAAYAYDGLGRRIEKDVDGTFTRYVYDAEDIFLEYEYDSVAGNNTLAARYGHGSRVDQPLTVERVISGEEYFYPTDHLGSIRALTDDMGNVVNEYVYDAYGRLLSIMEAVPQPYAFTAREYDPESGLMYYRTRYYDPPLGRFTTTDPILFNGGDTNLYRYVHSNPTKHVDPSGLATYACTRPLGQQPDDSGFRLHWYVCVDLPDGSKQCNSTQRKLDGPRFCLSCPPGRPTNDDPGDNSDRYTPSACEPVEMDDNDCVESCILRKWAEPRPPFGIPGGSTCISYSVNSVSGCLAACSQ